jgi:altronate hydrolase
VVKITGNSRIWEHLPEHMDVTVGAIANGMPLPAAGEHIYDVIIESASGRLTKAEQNGYTKSMNIYTVGPVL